MLLMLIPLGWLAIAAFAVILCRSAADADAVLLAQANNGSPRTAQHTTMHQRVPGHYAWRRPGVPSSRASAVRRRGTRVGR
jgi:hypothetical protein